MSRHGDITTVPVHFHFQPVSHSESQEPTSHCISVKRNLPQGQHEHTRFKKRKIAHQITSSALLYRSQSASQPRAKSLLLPHATSQWKPSRMLPEDSCWVESEEWDKSGSDIYKAFKQMCLRSKNRPTLKRSSLPIMPRDTPANEIKHFFTRTSRSASAPPDHRSEESQYIASQAALKSQLISALRLRLGGHIQEESCLRLRKYVAWNAWSHTAHMAPHLVEQLRTTPVDPEIRPALIQDEEIASSALEPEDIAEASSDVDEDGSDDEDLDELILDELLGDEEFLQSALPFSTYTYLQNGDESEDKENPDEESCLDAASSVDTPSASESEAEPLFAVSSSNTRASSALRPILKHANTHPLEKKRAALYRRSTLEPLALPNVPIKTPMVH